MTKAELETKVAKELKEVLDSEIYNNETFHLTVKKLLPILRQLPKEPVDNKYLKEIFDRCCLNPIYNLPDI
tara:strand:- start:510 stop:722 length:213 start_codon:yes stop_codon:yes gene_type:complete